MRNKTFAVAALVAFALVGMISLMAVDWTATAGRVRQIQYVVNYASNGTVASVDSQAAFRGYWVQVGDSTQFKDDPDVVTVKSYNLIAAPTTNITSGNITVTRAQLAGLIRHDAIDRP